MVATTVSTTLPRSALAKRGVATTRANAAPPPVKASATTAATGTAKNSASTTSAGSVAGQNVMPARRALLAIAVLRIAFDSLLRAGGFRPARVDLRLFRRGSLDVERLHLRRGRKLVGHVVGKLGSRHRRPHEALREDALAEVAHREVEPELAGVRVRSLLDQADRVRRGRRCFLGDHDRDR